MSEFLYSERKPQCGATEVKDAKDQHKVMPQIQLILHSQWFMFGSFPVIDCDCPDVWRIIVIVNIAVAY